MDSYERTIFHNFQNAMNHFDINDKFHRFTREAYLKQFDEANEMWRNIKPKKGEHLVNMTFEHQTKKETVYHPLNEDMKNIKIKELVLGKVHQRSYLTLKIIREPIIFTSLMFMAEDTTGEVIRVAIYNFKSVFAINSAADSDAIFAKGKWVIILEPFYKLSQDNFDQIRADNPTDILLFDTQDAMNKYIENVQAMDTKDVIAKGNNCMAKKQYKEAIDYYKRVFKKNYKDVAINTNLAEAYLELFYFSKVIIHLDIALKGSPNNPLLLLIKCQALIGLNRNKEAFDIAKSLPLTKTEATEILTPLKIKINNNNGIYNFYEMSQKEKTDFYLDNGNYMNTKVSLSFDKERGVKVISNDIIAPGELIAGSKALAAVNIAGASAFVTQEELKIILSTKLDNAPFDHEMFYQLYDGHNKELDLNQRKDKKEFTYDKIVDVIKHNSFMTRSLLATTPKAHGVWEFPSFLNHSCLSNCSICNIGDFMFIVSNKEIKPNEELTINYISFEIAYYKRKSDLYEGWGITCNCELCIYEENKIKNCSQKAQLLIYQQVINDSLLLRGDPLSQRLKELEKVPSFLEDNKKLFSCYELGIAYHLYATLLEKANNGLGILMQLKALHYAQNRNPRLERFVLFELGKSYYKTKDIKAFEETKEKLKDCLKKYVINDERYIQEVINEAYSNIN